jgi:hypothetical protein
MAELTGGRLFDTGVQKLIPRCDKCLNSSGDYDEKSRKYVRIFCKVKVKLSICLTN